MLEAYEKYLELINNLLLKNYFEQQRHYLHCKKGCSHCCKSGQYPFSELELQYLSFGYSKLEKQQQDAIWKKIEKIKEDKKNSSDKEFLYECPFLVDESCSLYKYRGLICRTHGLMFFILDKDGNSKAKIPNCVNLGLNYSNVYDKEQKVISQALWKKSGIEEEPLAYNIGLKALMKNSATDDLGLEFGKLKSLIDWFI